MVVASGAQGTVEEWSSLKVVDLSRCVRVLDCCKRSQYDVDRKARWTYLCSSNMYRASMRLIASESVSRKVSTRAQLRSLRQ